MIDPRMDKLGIEIRPRRAQCHKKRQQVLIRRMRLCSLRRTASIIQQTFNIAGYDTSPPPGLEFRHVIQRRIRATRPEMSQVVGEISRSEDEHARCTQRR